MSSRRGDVATILDLVVEEGVLVHDLFTMASLLERQRGVSETVIDRRGARCEPSSATAREAQF